MNLTGEINRVGKQKQYTCKAAKVADWMDRRGWLKSKFQRKESKMDRSYEVMFIVRPDVVDEELDKLIAGFEGTVTNGGGAIKNTERLGRRKLAYTVRKFNDGNYVLLTIEANGAVVAELERRLRVTEPVIKFITVRMDEEEKRLAKVRAIRNAHQKRSAMPVAHAPASPAPAAAAPVSEPVVSEPVPVASVEEAEPAAATA
jgi:small subunit ribosomal protein S6